MGKVSVRGTERHLKRRNERRSGKKKKTTGKRKEDEDRERERKRKKREKERESVVTYKMGISFWTGQTSFDEADRRKHPKWNRILKRAGISTWAKWKKGENED